MLTDSERAALNDPEYHECMAWNLEYRAETLAKEAARAQGGAKGHLFRAEELRYDARGGMTEAQATCAERSRLLGVLFARTVVTDIPPGWVRDYDDGLDWAKARKVQADGRLFFGVDPGVSSTAFVRMKIVNGVVVSCETWDEPRKGDGRC